MYFADILPLAARRIAMSLLAVLPAALGACSSAGSTTQTTITVVPEQETIVYRGAPDNVRQFTVDGIDVIMRPSAPSNHVIAAKLFIRGGSAALPEGVSPAVQSLALEVPPLSGPSSMSKEEYRRLIDRMVTGIIPADGRDFSTLTLRTVDVNWDRSWELFTGVVLQPRFDPVELRNAKERLITAVRNRFASPEAYAEYLADSAYFHGHPYGRFVDESDVVDIDADVLREHYKRLYVKSRLLLVVVGNVDSADLHRKIATTFARLPQGDYRERQLPDPPNANRSQLIVREPVGQRESVPTTYIVARHRIPKRTDSLYYPMMRLASFVSGSLFREIRIERNLSYAPDASAHFAKTPFGEISMSTTLPDSAWRTAKREVIDFFREYVIADQYITSGLSSWITSNYLKEQTSESQAHEIGVAEIYTGSWTNAFRTIDALRSMTAEQMNEAAQQYYRNFTIALVGDPSVITPQEYLPEEVKLQEAKGRYK